MYHHVSHIIVGMILVLLSCIPTWTNGQTTTAFCENSSPCLNNGTCLPNDVNFCQCSPQFTGAYCETELRNETLVITAYERLMELFIDGQQQWLTNAGIWNLPDYIQLQPTNRLIAVEAANLGDPLCGGVLASVYDGSLLTDNEWKCSPFAQQNWEILGFDDSSWPNAVEYGSNGNHSNCDQQLLVGNISSSSKWIWTAGLEVDFVAYCRGYLPFCENSSPCLNNGVCLKNDERFCDCLPQFTGTLCETELQNDTFVITAYEYLTELYIDGVEQSTSNGNNWNRSDYIGLPPMGRLIALKANNSADPLCAGVLASTFEAYALTNSNSWRCTSSNDDVDWTFLGYDDSSWPYATEYGSNVEGRTGCAQIQLITDIDPNAQWIWTSNPSTDSVVYCRGYLPICEHSSPCLNNGTCLNNDERFCDCLPQFTGAFCETATCEPDSPCQNGGTCNRNNESICSCPPGYSGTYCEITSQMSLVITAKTMLFELYVDGVPHSLLHGNNVSAVDEILLPPYGRLIAVTAIDTTSTCAGILASVTGDYLVTDASWKCHTDSSPQWYTLGFNDLNWMNAYVIGPNNNVTWPPECSILNEVSSISQNASWIWTPSIVNTPYYDDIIYCRAYLPFCELNSPCENGGTCNSNSANLCTCLHGYTGVFCENGRNLSISAKSAVQELYVDGVRMNLTYGNNWTLADKIELSNGNRLISVYAIDLTSTCAGILASVTDDFLVTDSKWKCTTVAAPEWYSIGFDDTHWADTYVIGPNGNVSWPEPCKVLTEILAISQNAFWIWTSTIPNAPYYDPVIYCRAYLPICERESPCQNGGKCSENNVDLCACALGFSGIYCESVACEGDAPCQNGGTCNQERDAVCQCPPTFTGTFCEFKVNRTITLTAKSIVYEFFIDGTKTDLIHATNWTIPDEVTLSPLSRLIGISAMDGTETCAGIIASVTGDYLMTDGINWRCGYIPDPQWFLLGWDDSVWDIAYVVGPNHNVTWPPACQILTGISSISPAANWIWTNTIPDTPNYHQRIYCRGYLPLCELESPCLNGGTCNKNNQTLCSCLVGYIGKFCETVDSKLLAVTAKEVIESLYVDGVQVDLQNGSDWLKTDNISIRSVSRLVALVAHQLDSSCIGPGILASVTDSRGNYVVTDASWRCSPLAENGWNDLGYDDSTWQPATLVNANNGLEVKEVQGNSCQEVPIIPSISPDAYWIWTASDEVGAYDVLVYCRGYLPICDVHPCKNGGTCNQNSNALCTCPSGYTGFYCENAIVNHDAEELQRSVLDEISDDTQSGTRPT